MTSTFRLHRDIEGNPHFCYVPVHYLDTPAIQIYRWIQNDLDQAFRDYWGI